MVFKYKGKKYWSFGGTMVRESSKVKTRKQAQESLRKYKKKWGLK